MRSVLIVDDEADALELLAYNLKAAGYEIITAKDGAEALNKARTEAPSLILLDVMLPEIDGLEVCRILRRDPITYDLPIIMVTARATEMARLVGLESGADAYLTKPVRPRVVVAWVNSILKQQGARIDPQMLFRLCEFTIDVEAGTAMINGVRVRLSARDIKLLMSFAQSLLRQTVEQRTVLPGRERN